MAVGKVLVRTAIMTLIGASVLALYQINNGLFDPLRYSVSLIALALTNFAISMLEQYWKIRRATQKG